MISIVHLNFFINTTSLCYLAGRAEVTVAGTAGAGPHLLRILILRTLAHPVGTLLGAASAPLLGPPQILLKVQPGCLAGL